MRNVVIWKQVFVGASLLLYAGSPLMAAPEVGPTLSNVGASIQQEGRRVVVTVSDKTGPVIGANVVIKGTTIGNITDMDGRAIIENVPANAVISVSYIGYNTMEVALKSNQSDVKVKLVEDTQALDEVVVTGYSTQAKKDITGSVAVVKTDDFISVH